MYFTEPVMESDVLVSEESPTHLVAHLQVLISHLHSFTPGDMMEILHKLYSALLCVLRQQSVSALDSLRSLEKWVYIRSCHTFVSLSAVALEQNPSFRHNLEPYLHKLPDSISNYSELFTAFGVNKTFTEEQILSTLVAVKKSISNTIVTISEDDSWNIVMAILNWLTENGMKEHSGPLELVFVPVESESEWPDLQPASDVTYTDNEFLKKFTLSSESEKPLLFIHSRVSVKIAECLHLTPLSEELDIAGDTFEDTGQYEPLTTRLRNILRDYKDGLTIVKELIQNADDAEATEVNICFDARTHSKDTDKLFFPGMAESHGPALVIHNNKVFSDEDFDNITKLAGATKQKKHLKIGKFGIGFCSVYHITDVPSFLSRDRLYIFDPTLSHLGKEIKNPALPGKRLKFKSRIIQNSKQLEPYQNLFGFDGHEKYQGTMFRLPFRTAPSELSGKCYSETTALELLDDIYNCSENLILFLQHVRTITYQRIDSGDAHPTTLFTTNRREISLPLPLNLNSTSALSIEINKRDDSKISKWLVSTHSITNSGKDAVANVACELKCGGNADIYSLHSSLSGEIFCYLPLAQSTGLPVHVSCNFAVINNRRGIWTADESVSAEEDEVEWNDFLMKSVIPRAYSSLLCCLKDMQQSNMLKNYKFHELWPLTSELKQQNPWSKFVSKLYESLASSVLFFSESRGEWKSLKDSKFLEPNILSRAETPACVMEVLNHCNFPIVHLPVKYRAYLPLGDSLISEFGFIRLFFSNLPMLSNLCSSRNCVVQYMLELYATECGSNSETSQVLKQYFATHACIPCSPDGNKMKLVTELIHVKAPFAKLYDPDEAMFPLEDLVKRDLPNLATKKLGIIVETIPWSYVIERAQTIQVLVDSSPTKAYNRVKFIIEAITSHTQGKPPNVGSNIDSIQFLPVMKKPADFPLNWCGEGMNLSCGKQMMRTGPRLKMPNVSIAGSQAVFLCEAEPQGSGCSRMSDRAEEILGLSSEPSFSSVLAHFKLIIKNAEIINSDWISEACDQIYQYLDNALKSKQLTCDCVIIKELPCIWTGNKFIHANAVSFMWSMNGPYLYQVPTVLRDKMSLCSELGIKEHFSTEDIQQSLLKMQADFQGCPIDEASQAIFKQLLPLLHEVEFKDSTFLLPDEKYILHAAENLAYNDAPWAPQDDSYTYVHSIIPRDLARKIGVNPVRSKFLDKYISEYGFKGGVKFGQREELTRRIQNIIRDYPLDVTLLKELLQNADDAKATKMHVILDQRFHGTESVLSEEWQDLQGPALMVWNDSVFSERDLEGIQELGLGSKRSEADTIGQYGIGFNVVYHITDCPSFVTNNETLCIMDPHCRYVPGADKFSPGRRFDNLKAGFWDDFPDVKSAYLRQGIDNLPQELLGGSLFRLPIRHNKRKIAHSEITEDPESVLNAGEFCNNLCKWMKNMKEAMLFLNNVSELKLHIIEESRSQLKTIFHYQSKIEESPSADHTLLQGALSTFKTHKECRPCVVMYPLTLTGGGQGKDMVEKWLIQQGVGDICNSGQVWQYVDTVKPRHGIAAPLSTTTKREDFKGQVFCFLPLPVESGLPVHVNGHFILNSTRRELWRSTDINRVDDRSKWNNNLLQALSSSYADFLFLTRTHYVAKEYQNVRTALSCIEHYYSLFPTFTNGKMWNILAQDVYRSIVKRNFPVLCVIKTKPNGEGYITEWCPPKSVSPANHVYYWAPFHYYSGEHMKIYPILERVGMKITPAPSQIMKCFNDIIEESKSKSTFSSVTHRSIFDYYTKHSTFSANMRPTAIEDTQFHDIASFVMFTKYLLEEEHSLSSISVLTPATKVPRKCVYPSSPFSHYLLLTADGVLRKFEEKAKVLRSQFSQLFPNSLHHFLHHKLLGAHYTSSYFIIPGDKDTSRVGILILQLMEANFPITLKSVPVVSNATAIINVDQLKSLWKCFGEDKVFNKYIHTVISSWALLLTEDNRLFSSSSDILPINHVYSTEGAINNFCKVVKKLNMPFLKTSVIIAESNCPRFTDCKRILSNLYHTNLSTPFLTLLVKTDLNIIIEYLKFSWKELVCDTEMIKHIQSLPLFENIDGTYTSIWKKNAYIWPYDACPVAYQKWLEGFDEVFIKGDAKWSELGTAKQLSVNILYTEDLYVRYIFPHFYQMDSKERYKHLQFIKDFLYPKYEVNSNYQTRLHISKDLIDQKQRAISFIYALKSLRCIGDDGTSLHQVSAFCDQTKPIFNAFPSNFQFLPKDYKNSEEWLSFFRRLGLQQHVSQEKFLQFCQETACGQVTNAKKCSHTLLEYLFIENTWVGYTTNFLQRVSKISFVQQEPLPHLIWLVPAIFPVNQMVKLRGSAPLNRAPLLWTMKPIIKFPDCSITSGTMSDSLGIVCNPTVLEVVENIKNICRKSQYTQHTLFANYSEDLICPSEHHTLLHIMSLNFSYLKQKSAMQCNLISLPCIPVYNITSSQTEKEITSSQTDKEMVLVKPSYVIHNSWSQDEVRKFHPFLHCLPEDLTSVGKLLQSNGVKDKLELSHIQITLESVFKASEGHELEINTDEVVIAAIMKLNEFLRHNEASDRNVAETLTPLYLPDSDNILKPSKSLLYADTRSYWGSIHLELDDVPYFHFNILKPKYKHDALQICRLLPESVRPIGLSVACDQVVVEESQEAPASEVALQLRKTIEFPDIPDGIVCLVSRLVNKQDNEDDLKEKIRDYLSKVEVITVTDLRSQIVLKESKKCIGTLKMRFCFIPGKEKSVLYLDSDLSYPVDDDDAYLEVANHLCGVLCQNIKEVIKSDQKKDISKAIKMCLKARSGDRVKSILLGFGVQLDGARMQKLTKKLGEVIPECWHHRLDQDIDNVFNPMEYVGYEDREGHIIVAQVVHPVKLKEGEQKLEKKIRIYGKDDDKEGKDVSILSLYKFLVGSKKPKLQPVPAESEDLAVTVFDGDDDLANYRGSLIAEDLVEIKKKICTQLRDIWRLSPDLKRKGIKRMYLRWHPDKNTSNPQDTEKIFKFLLKQIENLENRRPLDDPTVDKPTTGDGGGGGYYRRRHHYWNRGSSYNYHLISGIALQADIAHLHTTSMNISVEMEALHLEVLQAAALHEEVHHREVPLKEVPHASFLLRKQTMKRTQRKANAG